MAAERNLDTIDLNVLREAGLVSKKELVKVLAKGTLTRKVTVEANAFSATARKAIEEAGGTANELK